ncbi:MAG: hypothetical protein Q4C83_00900 [Candidatus Saccharibacteria bacterium]|nr:hypothetical protein [Candidatus Saccharibacteria bacterium]
MARHKVRQLEPMPVPRSCGKNRYTSEQEAQLVADQQEIIFSNQGLKLRVYHCAFCGGWHLTKRRD